MVALTVALFALTYGFKGGGRVGRVAGALLLVTFAAYQFALFNSSFQGDTHCGPPPG